MWLGCEQLLCFLILFLIQIKGDDKTYKVALSQYVPSSNNITLSLLDFAKDSSLAQDQGAEMIIFPEFSLFSPTSRSQVEDLCENISKFGAIPCDDPDNSNDNRTSADSNHDDEFSVVKQLSCIARQYGLYLLANFCNLDGDNIWNSNLVFDRHGALITEYRKSHVYLNKVFDQPSEPDYVTVNASFNNGTQTLGLFMCKDILYPTPGPELRKRGIVSFAYNSFIDFKIVSKPMFQLWSEEHSAILLASNAYAAVYINGTSVGHTVNDSIVVANLPFTP